MYIRKREDSDSDSDDDDDSQEDLSNPDVCSELITKVKDARGTVTTEFQKSLKRLKRFNERKMDRHQRKKLKQAATMTMTPSKLKSLRHIHPKSLDSTAETLLNETPKKGNENDGEKTDTLSMRSETKRTDLDNLLEDMEEMLCEKMKSDNEEERANQTLGNEFAFNPDISFPNVEKGNRVLNTSRCSTDCTVPCGRLYPGVIPARSGHDTLALSFITGELDLNMINFFLVTFCNVLLFLCRVDQYQAARMKSLRLCPGQATAS